MRRRAALALGVTLGAASGVTLGVTLGASAAGAQPPAAGPDWDPTAAPEVVRLWPNAAPLAAGDGPADRPTLTVYRPFGRPAGEPGAAVVIAPGGGYSALASNHEGRQVAGVLNALGVTAFVLRYRVAPYRAPAALLDAQRALRVVRARAAEWNVRADQVGLLGFSAGGHLAASAATRWDGGRPADPDPAERQPSRPDFVILGYPVVSLAEPYAHRPSAENLLGDRARDPAALAEWSAERHVTPRTPPTFLAHTDADDGVPPEHSVAFYLALRRAGVPAELHVFARGAHGLGVGLGEPGWGEWTRLLAVWLRGVGAVTAPR